VFAAFAAGNFDRITDFQDGIDRISLPPMEGANAAKLDALHIQSAAHDTVKGCVIEVAGHVIFLDHVTPSQLGLNDFLFG
ncbi:MAG: hypothetical protein EBU97_06485, partial [Rhodobacteraceae bacterium]|nr:hypothetical protein [Paracoccaceae bacterium]